MNNVMIKYVSSSGHSYNLKTDGLKIRKANFHSYKWKCDTTELQYGANVNRFTRDPQEYSTTLTFTGSYFENDRLIRSLHGDWEQDIFNKTPGRIYWGKCYIECYITESSTGPDDNYCYVDDEIIILCPYPFWIEEAVYTIDAEEIADNSNGGKVYPYKYPYKYGKTPGGITNITIDHYAPSNFTLTCYGPTSQVYITIGGHVYNVDYPIYEGERLVIDSRTTQPNNRRIYVVHSDGTVGNIFNYRSQQYSVFEKLPAGDLRISYSKTYKIVLTVYIERSEPVWT